MWQSVIVLPAKLSLVPVLSTTVEEKKEDNFTQMSQKLQYFQWLNLYKDGEYDIYESKIKQSWKVKQCYMLAEEYVKDQWQHVWFQWNINWK